MVSIDEERLPSKGLTDADRRRAQPGYGWYPTGTVSAGSNGNGNGHSGNGHSGNGNGHADPRANAGGNGHANGNGHASGNGNGNGNGNGHGYGKDAGASASVGLPKAAVGANPGLGSTAGFGVLATRPSPGNGTNPAAGNGGSTATSSTPAARGTYGRPLDLSGWQPVDESRRQPARAEARAADTPAFRRVENGSPRYRGPEHSDPAYSPIAYHFSRVQEHEAPNPWKIWGGLFGFLGVGAMLLLVISLPALLRHSEVAAPSPTPADTTLYATYPAGVMTITPSPSVTPKPTAWPDPTPVATFRTYIVKAGDNLSAIANKFHLKAWELLAANPALGGNADQVQRGMTLYIPSPGQMKP